LAPVTLRRLDEHVVFYPLGGQGLRGEGGDVLEDLVGEGTAGRGVIGVPGDDVGVHVGNGVAERHVVELAGIVGPLDGPGYRAHVTRHPTPPPNMI
jgi:hypothetical protein